MPEIFNSFFPRLFFIFFLTSVSSLAWYGGVTAEEFNNSDFNLSNSGGSFPTTTSTVLTPKDGKKIFWSFHSQNISSGRVTSEVTRIYIPRSRTLHIFDLEEKNSPIESFDFNIESPRENNFFRIKTIDSNPIENFLPTVEVENSSDFSFTMNQWRLEGKNFSFPLPDEEMESGEKRRFIIPLNHQGGEITLVSPLSRIKDEVLYPLLEKGKIFTRKEAINKRDARPEFYVTTEE